MLRWQEKMQNEVELQNSFVVQGIGEKRGKGINRLPAEYNLEKKEKGKGRVGTNFEDGGSGDQCEVDGVRGWDWQWRWKWTNLTLREGFRFKFQFQRSALPSRRGSRLMQLNTRGNGGNGQRWVADWQPNRVYYYLGQVLRLESCIIVVSLKTSVKPGIGCSLARVL